MIPSDFITLMEGGAVASQEASHIPASFTIAQAAIESGWGTSQLFIKAKNIFGIKVYPGWTGATYAIQTREYEDGELVVVPANWCAYPDYESSITDHARFLTTEPRYSACFAHPYSGAEFAIEVQKAGYSTNPNYAELISSIIREHGLTQYDN